MWNNQGGGYQQGGEGGGYMSPGGFGTPQASQEKKIKDRAHNLLPVTVGEILSATQSEEKFYTGDIEVSQVTIVGIVRSVKEAPTRIDYEIDDMTGPPFEVKQFVDNDDSTPDSERVSAMQENTYVRVNGHVRSFGGKRSVVAFRMMPLTDMNELTCHMLEVIHSHAALSQQSSNHMKSNGLNNNTMGSGDVSGFGAVNGLTATQNQVHVIIRNNMTDQGANVEQVCKQLRGVPEKAIREAIDFLSSEGHIYSTIDEDHYKATDS
ncbi:replication protein A 32 kDa subunit-like [Ylistrum balloti]|uniref:replication protein A 32 kDa subunit-like n=1 Tax=Ylistrum balloti TaxID=509963 RepID=UPI002905C533|nr:replication protein A 32 kDa subunit-like [Ylistrum balloti]